MKSRAKIYRRVIISSFLFWTLIYTPSSQAWMATAPFWSKTLHLFAGKFSGGSGFVDGPRLAAKFSDPQCVAIDPATSNIYITEQSNNTIRKITPGGVVSTLAGDASQSPGSADGTGSAARFNDPEGLVVDSLGNIFVADSGNNIIRKITPAGVVTTFAGTAGELGADDGIGAAARFVYAGGLAIDATDNLYVADWSVIRKITPAGVVTTFAGVSEDEGTADGTGTNARFSAFLGIALDLSSGDIYVSDSNNSTIRKITPSAVVTTFAGAAGISGITDGTGSAARFGSPMGLTVDSSGNIFVVDEGSYTIRKITSGGVVTTIAGTALISGSSDGTGSAANFYYPYGIAVDSLGNLFVADMANSIIRKITPSAVVTTFAGSGPNNDHFDGTGGSARFSGPFAIAPDSSGNLYVADTGNNLIRKITSSGVVTTFAGSYGANGNVDGIGSAASFNTPTSIAVDSAGNIFVLDIGNSTIRKITPARVVSTFAGSAGIPGSADGVGSAARFNYPFGIAIDSSDNLYVAETQNSTIRKITPGAVVTTIAGSAGLDGSADGNGSAARFNRPYALAVNSTNEIIVADSLNNTIRKITPAGDVTTIAGTVGNIGSADGTGSAARFDFIRGLAIDSAGNIYAADSGGSTVRKITPGAVVSTIIGKYGFNGIKLGPLSSARLGSILGVTVSKGRLFILSDNIVLWSPIK